MSTRWWISIIGILFIIIGILTWLLFFASAPNSDLSVTPPEDWSVASSTSESTTSTEPLHARVMITSPQSGSTIGHSFTISGEAPGPWYFEASFPIKVITPQGDTIGTSHAEAQSDWMTSGQVPFVAVVDVILSYSGPAIIALLRDNPSGLPENDDSIEMPIVVQ